jgi:hypothetical protein
MTVTQSTIGARITTTSYDGTNLLEHRLEGTYVAGKTVTLSVKTGSVCSNAGAMLYTRTSADSWQHTPINNGGLLANTINTFTAFIPADAGKINLRIYNNSSAGALDVDVEYVQLELGSVATDFEHRSYGEELALCQRYYFLTGKDSKHLTHFGFTRSGYLSYIYGTISYPCEMRDLPTLSWGGSIGGETFTGGYEAKTGVTALVNDTSGTKQGGFRATFSTSWAAGDEAYLYDTDGTGYIAFDAEL